MEKTLYYLPFACPAHRQLYWLVYCQPTVSRAAWAHSGFTSAAPPSRSLSLPLAPSRSGHDIGFPEITSQTSSSSGPASSAAASGVESPESGTVAPVSG